MEPKMVVGDRYGNQSISQASVKAAHFLRYKICLQALCFCHILAVAKRAHFKSTIHLQVLEKSTMQGNTGPDGLNYYEGSGRNINAQNDGKSQTERKSAHVK